jgi:L-malate glycosyltransferase
MKPLRILHCHSTFNLGGKEARAVQLMNAFADRAEHVILSSVPDALSARDAIAPGVKVDFPSNAPPLYGKPSIGRYRDLARYMAAFDLVLTYNWGSMDAVGAKRLFPRGTPRLIHHEDGFNADEAVKLNWKRNWFRRLMLPCADAVVVPSQTLERIAREVWGCKLLERIANGIPVQHYADPPAPDAIPGFARRDGDVVVGTVAGLRAVKNLPRLVRAVAAAGDPRIRLVIVGEGPERDAIVAEAQRCGIAERVTLPGFMAEPHRYIGLFDIFALSSDSEQFPISLVEAMAAALPVVATHVGDVANIVDDASRPFIVPVQDEAQLADKLARLADSAALRAQLGEANQRLAQEEYGEDRMILRYAALYEKAAGQPGALTL